MTAAPAAQPPARAAATRQQILDAAATLFREQGYKATTLRDIARRLDMGAGSLYYHFRGKDEILRAVLELGILAIDSAVGDALETARAAQPLERLRVAIGAASGALLDDDDCPTAYVRIYNQLPRALKRLDDPLRQRYMERWRRLVRDARDAGDIAADFPVETFVEFLHGAISRLPDWHAPGREGGEALGALIADWVLGGIVRR